MGINITELNIRTLLSADKYVIPIYQRNYAWGETEVTQLIQDVVDYSQKKKSHDYYIGTLVVFERKTGSSYVFETIDGQQRLTTLTILLSAIKNHYPNITDIDSWYKLNLEFDSRELSTNTLQAIFHANVLNYIDYNTEIMQAYDDSIKALKRILKDNHNSGKRYDEEREVKTFFDYLVNKVIILRVPVPPDTDLNHYFEIMNSRGEQLEKHEILKAKFLEILHQESQELEYAFNLIWEACSNMERYVQYGFKIPSRNLIFGKDNWDRLMFNSIDEISKELIEIDTPESPSGDIQEQSIENIIDAAPVKEPKPAGGEPTDRFNSVINFSNFLLHVLRLQTTNDVALDDKRLIELFDPYINTTDKEKRLTFVKEFGFNILRCKFLFDKYVIKREYLKGTDRWSLKKVKWYNGNQVSYVNTFGDKNGIEGENREILMLLAMFHVSTPTLVYKHWLNASLRYVFENNDITPNGYKTYLENLAKAFLYDRYIALTPIEYFDIIYTNNGIAKNTEVDESKLDQGTAVENFIFNYLDFLLWKKHKSIFDDFEYSFRSSVEHYYPQNPIEPTQRIDNVHLDKFGNLCLISNSKNSRLSNYMPQAKKDHYQSSKTIDSIKQRLMMNFDNWNINEICEHGAEMKRLLMHDIQPNLGAAAQILT